MMAYKNMGIFKQIFECDKLKQQIEKIHSDNKWLSKRLREAQEGEHNKRHSLKSKIEQ